MYFVFEFCDAWPVRHQTYGYFLDSNALSLYNHYTDLGRYMNCIVLYCITTSQRSCS